MLATLNNIILLKRRLRHGAATLIINVAETLIINVSCLWGQECYYTNSNINNVHLNALQ